VAAAPVFSVIGKPVPRIEGPEKVTGRARYSADYTPAGTLWGRHLRSPHPHARIVSIDPSRARALPGVRSVITAADVPAKKLGRSISDYEVLCSERVRYVGDPVAAVAADTQEIAEAALMLIDVEYEELPFVNDPIAAMRPEAPEIHSHVREYQGFPEVPEDLHNVCSYVASKRGDLEKGFSEADIIVENTYTTQLMHQGYIEPHASVVQIAPDGRVDIWATHKVPFALKNELATILDRRPDEIHIHQAYIGGEFGAKANPQDVPSAYYLALTTGRPVKFVTPSTEDLTATTPRHPGVIKIRTGARRDGTITAWDAQIAWNSGAYGGVKPPFFSGNLGGSNNAAGWWDIPNVRIEARMVYTNQVPCAYMRAPGQPQAVFAAEMQMDAVARELGMDRLEIRLKNLPERSLQGQPIVAKQVLETAADAVDWSGPKPKWVGRGLGFGARGTGAGASTSDITLNADGTLEVICSVPDSGTSGHTVVAQVVAETWGIPLERVSVIHGDTDSVPADVGSGGSSITNSAGNVAVAASKSLQSQLAPLAASALGAASADFANGGWRGDNDRFMSLEDFAREVLKGGEPLAHVQLTMAPERSPIQQYCAQAVEVEVDPETGRVSILKLVAVNDVGTIINEVGHQGQIDGSLIQGVGYALIEELVVEDGRITTANMGDYKIPSIKDIPHLETINIRTTGPGPFEAKGIGETPTVPTAGAIACAVADAIGTPVRTLPLTPERVFTALEDAR
jgi:CO/xanthine dehydrogenase Mo-binding subunit